MNRECHRGKQAFILAPLRTEDSTSCCAPASTGKLSPEALDKSIPRSLNFSASR